MVCQACGAPMVEGVQFCARCGFRVAVAHPGYAAYPPVMAMPLPRVQRNLQTLGVLWCVFGAYRILGGIMGMFFLHAMALHSFSRGWLYSADPRVMRVFRAVMGNLEHVSPQVNAG